MLDYNYRCPLDEAAKNSTIWTQPGELDQFFWGLVNNETLQQRYNLTVLSGPTINDHNDPWVVQLDGFLSALECFHLIDLGHQLGYQRSKDVGKANYDGSYSSYQNSARTSTTAWCATNSVCGRDPLAQAITARIAQLTGIPARYSENLQLLRYQVGQRYGVHHDYTANLVNRPPGVRILTVFLYLNDDGLVGGGTNFPLGNLTIQPKQGRAVLWPSVLNDRPGQKDPRTEHQALPVQAGVKFGANAWIHERDFQTPHAKGCTH